jgi:hypothetical protein
MDTVTYPDEQVAAYIGTHFVPFSASMGVREHWPLFRSHHMIWTPSVGFADHRGQMHYDSPGYLAPAEFLSTLRIGRARCLMAWTRNAEAARELEEAAEVENSFAPEALFWLGVAHFLERRDSAPMYRAWERLTKRYPDSPWAARTYREHWSGDMPRDC